MAAKKKMVDNLPANPFARFMKRTRFQHTTNSGANLEYTPVSTGMVIPGVDSAETFAWEIYAVTITPLMNMINANDGPATMRFQLVQGSRDTSLGWLDAPGGDGQPLNTSIIANGLIATQRDAEGSMALQFPVGLDIMSPIPYYGETITFGSNTTNNPIFNSLVLGVTIWWAPIPITSDNVFAMLRMSGQL